jgi:hypothetical protein
MKRWIAAIRQFSRRQKLVLGAMLLLVLLTWLAAGLVLTDFFSIGFWP